MNGINLKNKGAITLKIAKNNELKGGTNYGTNVMY